MTIQELHTLRKMALGKIVFAADEAGRRNLAQYGPCDDVPFWKQIYDVCMAELLWFRGDHQVEGDHAERLEEIAILLVQVDAASAEDNKRLEAAKALLARLLTGGGK